MDIRDRAPVLGRWVIGPRLGRGGMGTVYSAVDRESGERCAVKVMRGDTASPPGGDPRVLRELRTAEALVHPHIVRTHACGYADGRYFLVMELCEGGSLDERVRQGEPPGPAAAVALFLDVLDALQHAHTAPLEALDAQGRPVQVLSLIHI